MFNKVTSPTSGSLRTELPVISAPRTSVPGAGDLFCEDKKGVSIDYWWDSSLRLWTILARDRDGNQVGEADYAPNKTLLPEAIASMKKEHGIK